MSAVVHGGHAPRQRSAVPWPPLQTPNDAIVKLARPLPTAMNGSSPGRARAAALARDSVGVVLAVGSEVTAFQPGDRVLVMGGMHQQTIGGAPPSPLESVGTWHPGRTFDGLQTEFLRVRDADGRLYRLADNGDDDAGSALGDVLPNGFDNEALVGALSAGCQVVIVGAGPVGLTALLTAQFHAPATIMVIDDDNGRLAMARRFGATHTVNSRNGHSAEVVMVLTRQIGVDLAIDAVGSREAMAMCQAMVGADGRVVKVNTNSEWSDGESDEG